jgi:hypothetical protein
MRRKSLRTFLQILLLGLLLGTTSSAYADAISITSVSLSNLQIVPTAGMIVFTTQLSPAPARAHAVVTDGFDGPSSTSVSQTVAQTSINLGFAGAAAVSDFTNMSFSANSNVMLSGCLCSFEAEGFASLRKSFMIVGGSGNVDVNMSALLETMQMSLHVVDPADLISIHIFSFDSRLSIRPPTNSTLIETERQLSHVVTLQFDKEYILLLLVNANSRAGQNEIAEPASVVLLVSGLGFMAGFVKKWRTGL